MANFTPISAAIGGALIGLAAALLMLLNGRIAGITGIFAGLIEPQGGDRTWRATFIVGLIAAPFAAAALGYRDPCSQTCRRASSSSRSPVCWSASARG